jgi:hypothetical protein
MRFKVGDKVILKEAYKGETSGEVIRQCAVTDCSIIKLTNGIERHFFYRMLLLAPIKNQQLLFNFMNKD